MCIRADAVFQREFLIHAHPLNPEGSSEFRQYGTGFMTAPIYQEGIRAFFWSGVRRNSKDVETMATNRPTQVALIQNAMMVAVIGFTRGCSQIGAAGAR